MAGVALLHTPAFARKLTIVALGDSTTAGAPFYRSPLEAPPDGAGDADAFYGTWIMKREPDWTVLNYGISGQRSDEIRDRLNKALELRPQYVIVLAGVNDIDQRDDLQLTTQNLAGMYSAIQLEGAVPVAATILPFDTAAPKQSAQIRQLNAWIRETAKRLRIPLVDFNNAVIDPAQPDRLNGTPDGIHPDMGAYRQMGLAALKVLRNFEHSQ